MSFQQTSFALPDFRVKVNTELHQIVENGSVNKLTQSPAVSTSERDALPAVAGNIVFNTSISKFQGFDGSSWVNLN